MLGERTNAPLGGFMIRAGTYFIRAGRFSFVKLRLSYNNQT